MIDLMIAFGFGIFAGTILGMVLMVLMVAASRDERDE